MKTIYTNTCEVINFKRLKNSINGNPKYSIKLKDEYGSVWIGITKSDAGFCYGLSLNIGQVYEVQNHETKTKIIIDGMKLVNN